MKNYVEIVGACLKRLWQRTEKIDDDGDDDGSGDDGDDDGSGDDGDDDGSGDDGDDDGGGDDNDDHNSSFSIFCWSDNAQTN